VGGDGEGRNTRTLESKKALAAAKQRVRELFAELFEEVVSSADLR